MTTSPRAVNRRMWGSVRARFDETALVTVDLAASFDDVDPQALAGVGLFGGPSPLAEPVEPEIVYAERNHHLHGSGEITTWDNHDCRP